MNIAKAKELRKNSTDAERVLWQRLRAHRFARYKFRRQQPLGHYIVDFVCFEKHLIIELDGGQRAEQVVYDAERSAWLQSQGFRVLRFWNHEVLKDVEAVAEVILRECERETLSPSSSPTRGEERKMWSILLQDGRYECQKENSNPD